MGTELTYKFNSYKILKQEENLLRINANPFSVVVLTTLMAIKHSNSTDDQLKTIKHDLYDEMMKRKMEKPVRQGIYDYSLLLVYMVLMNSLCSVFLLTMCGLKIRKCCVCFICVPDLKGR